MYKKKRGTIRSYKEGMRGLKGKRTLIRDNKKEGETANKIHLSIMSQIIVLYMLYQVSKFWLVTTPLPKRLICPFRLPRQFNNEN